MKKKVLSMTLVLAMSAAALAGCRSTDSGAQASKEETSASTDENEGYSAAHMAGI